MSERELRDESQETDRAGRSNPTLLSDRSARIALVTHRGLPGLSVDDQVLAAELRRTGFEVDATVWDDSAVVWDGYDALVIRSTWDYHLRPTEFRRWIRERERGRAMVFNPPSVLEWNADKSYLRAIAAAGVPVVPTRWVERGDRAGLAALLEETGWPEVVVKPVVSGGGYRTWRATRDVTADDERRFRAECGDHAVMVQPLLHEIVADGELSLMFIDGAPSHAVRKRPRAGDFRVQHEHGGTAEPIEPDQWLVRAAARALDEAPERTLYARVDGCVVDGVFTVMELELLEPALFFRSAPGAAERLAAALQGALRRRIR